MYSQQYFLVRGGMGNVERQRISEAQKAVSGSSMQQPSAQRGLVQTALWRPDLVPRAPKMSSKGAEAEAEAGGESYAEYGGVRCEDWISEILDFIKKAVLIARSLDSSIVLKTR